MASLTATEDAMRHGRFTDVGQPANWIAAGRTRCARGITGPLDR
jgi:hypothetical protein